MEDIAALIEEAGGSAFLLGLSSGGALALEAAAVGLPINKVVAYEPPYVIRGRNHVATLRQGPLPTGSGRRSGPDYAGALRRVSAPLAALRSVGAPRP